MYNPCSHLNNCWLRAKSAFHRDLSRRGRETKRPGLEDHERAPACAATWPALRLTSLLLAALLSGCAQNTFQVQDPAQTHGLTSPLAQEILLEVDDSGVKWGAGKVGAALATALVNNRTFSQVHYPIYPTRMVPLKLRVVARGDIETDAGEGMAKSFVTGFLLFLPVGVLQYRDTFTITAEVTVVREGRKFGPLIVESRVATDHTLFAGPDSYAAQAERLALDNLAARISAALAEHPEWFSR